MKSRHDESPAAAGGTVTAVLEESAVAAWGWRIPFILGAFLALAALYLRKGMEESEVFHENTDAAAVAPQPLPRRQIVRAIVLMIAMTSGITAAHYTWTSYASTYAITQQGMSASAAYWSSVVAQLIALVSLPFWGRLSDKVGRRPMMIGFAALMILFQLPLTGMISSAPWTLLVAASVALVIVAIPGALLSATLSENFPTRVRTQGIGFAYSVSVAVFGGTAPYLNAQLIEWGVGWMSSIYIMVLCACTAVAVWLMPETKGIDLKDV